MKKSALILIICIVILTFAGCGNLRLKKSSEDFVGSNYEVTVAELEKTGFSNIILNEMDDLTSSDSRNDGYVESISINGESSFDKTASFPKDSEVVLTYHIIKKIAFPISFNEIEKTNYTEIGELLTNSGYTNVSLNEVYDLDPDEDPNASKSEVVIGGITSFDKGDNIAFDADISVNCHMPYDKYTLNLDIHFISNLIFNKYDVDFKLDDKLISSISHGKDWAGEIRAKAGKHTLVFTEKNSSSPRGEIDLDITSDIDAKYTICCYSDYVSVENDYIDRKTELAEGQVKMPCTESNFKFKDYQEIVAQLNDLGFINIKEEPLYDIIFGVTDVGETARVTIDGSNDYKRGDIFNNDVEVIVSYHLKYEDDPVRIAEAKEREEKKAKEAEERAEAEKKAEEAIEYTSVSVKEMVNDLESNALNAKEKYEGKYLEITGLLSNIDSGGEYLSLEPDEYSITGVQCYTKNDTQKNQLGYMTIGDTVTLRGKCKSVGEILGYSLDITSINGYDEGKKTNFKTTDDGYIIVSANDLVKLLEENPLNARNSLKGQNIKLSGKLGTIDSNGRYIGIDSDDEWSLTNIQCYIKNDEQKSKLKKLSSGTKITIRGKCTDVGEILGYSINIESIE